MNKAVLFFGALISFVVPIGVVVLMNAEQFAGQSGDQPNPTGKLVYYYSPS